MPEIALSTIWQARERLKGVVFHTELVPTNLVQKPGLEVFIKTESLQYTGSFKVRGAYNKIAQLTDDEKTRGIIASSAGNHAQGVAMAARTFGVKATIVMPEGAPLQKIASTRALGAEVVLHGAAYDDAYARARAIQEENGQVFIHPFDDVDVIAGQGTIGLEILSDRPDVDMILVPVGGGGLAAGVALAAKSIKPSIRVIGVEAAGAASMRASFAAGKPTTLTSASTIADGIAVKTPGELTYSLCKQYLDDVVIVDEDEIATTILMLLEKCKIVSEGAGAAAIAALYYEKCNVTGKVAVILSGGNIDVNVLSRIIEKGLVKAGRRVDIRTPIEDKPGKLGLLLDLLGECGANVLSIQHDRTHKDISLGQAMLELTLETQDKEHVQTVMRSMRDKGYKVT